MKTLSLTQERLIELLEYDPSTGVFTRKKSTNNQTAPGQIAGHPNADGYVTIRVDKVSHVAHRLAFLWMTGKYPDINLQVDHINGIRNDNRWSNLRLVTARTNQHNRISTDNRPGRTSKHLGVSHKKLGRRRWEASIRVDRKLIYLGRFSTEAEAAKAYLEAKAVYHPDSYLAATAVGQQPCTPLPTSPTLFESTP